MTTFIQAIANAGFIPPDHIAPGKHHRFPGIDKGSSNTAGYCFLFDDCRGGYFGDFSTGARFVWQDGSGNGLTAAERRAMHQQIKAEKRRREAEKEAGYLATAAQAQQIWKAASRSIDHPYSRKKSIIAFGARQHNNALLIPMHFAGKLVNIQRIYPDGSKRFLRGGKVSGCCCLIGTISDHLFVAEGYSTSCSLREHTGSPIAVAFTANNLKGVAISMWRKYPRIRITIAADNDVGTELSTGINPGLVAARKAAAAVGGDVIYPDFSDEPFGEGMSDFNDYLVNGGSL
jgi:putative DNA primase/helicase